MIATVGGFHSSHLVLCLGEGVVKMGKHELSGWDGEYIVMSTKIFGPKRFGVASRDYNCFCLCCCAVVLPVFLSAFQSRQPAACIQHPSLIQVSGPSS